MNHIQLENISKIYNANSSQAQSALALLAEGMDSIAVKSRLAIRSVFMISI